MNYQERINQVVDYIGQHVDEELSLEELCQIACLSKYHFHRLFTAYVGASLQSYIKWLRLKRAANQLVNHKERAIINVALGAGYETHESFSRAFKLVCGKTPSQFRRQPNWCVWEYLPGLVPIKGEKIMSMTIKELPARRTALMEHHGDPMKLYVTLDKLISWAKAQPIDLKPAPGKAFGLGYHDPRDVPAEDFRFDLALSVPNNYTLDDQVIERVLPGGRYAVATHKGSRHNIGDTIVPMYRDWLPESGEQLADMPCILSYLNFDDEAAETELLTEVQLLLK
jgi:AraC family transcriptional regulator